MIINPVAGGGATGRRWPELRRSLESVLDDWDHGFTLQARDATRMVRQAVEDGYDHIVLVGGDGTANEGATGMLELIEEGATDLPELSLVRFGTGGDFARHLELPGRLPEAVAHLRHRVVREFDLGRIEFEQDDGTRGRRAFINIASFGMSGVVVREVNASKKRLKGASFFLGMSRSLLTYRRASVVVRVDGEQFFRGKMVTVAVANGTHFGGGMHIARGARSDDGLFRIVVQQRAGLSEVLRIPDLYSGEIADWQTVAVGDGRVVEAEATDDTEVLLDVDGESVGRLPARFEVLPRALRLRVP